MGWGAMKPLDQGSLNHTPAVAPALAGMDAHRIDAGSVPKRDKRETAFAFEGVVNDICTLPWEAISEAEVLRVAMAYYYFSVQFRESLEGALRVYPADEKLTDLARGECATDNLSPWEGVAAAGEKMNHDDFMHRLLALQPMSDVSNIERAGAVYLSISRSMDDFTKAKSIASYEDGGLQRVFGAMLRAPSWNGPGQKAFRHFLEKHIEFDSDEDAGHGALSRHVPVDDSILPLWLAFEDILRCAVPGFAKAESSAAE
jgi:hypothetical protein